jgi:hypothetical protein
MNRDDHADTKSDVWAARSLGCLSILTVALGYGPLLLATLTVMWRLILLRHWSYHSIREALFGIGTALLLLVGLLLIVQYWRYPRLLFRMPALLFWLCSAFYVPLWIVVFLFGGEQIYIPRWSEIQPYLHILLAFGLLPAAHVILSLVGLFSRPKRIA